MRLQFLKNIFCDFLRFIDPLCDLAHPNVRFGQSLFYNFGQEGA